MKIGNKLIPENRLPSMIEAVKTLYGKFAFEEKDDETVASRLGHTTSRSGAYVQKRADLRSFGLIEPRGAIKVTQIGKKVSYPDTQKEEQEGLIQAILNIELWKLIYEKYTKKEIPLPSDFWTDIREWTGLPPEEAKKAAENARKAYEEDIKYIKREFVAEKGEKSMEEGKVATSMSIPEEAIGRITLKGSGYVDVKDETTYKLAEAYLKVFAEKLGIKKKTEKEG